MVNNKLLILAVGMTHVKNESSIYGLALHEFSIAQWIERLPGVWEVIGLNPVGDSDFFLCPMLVIISSSYLFSSLKFTILHFFHK